MKRCAKVYVLELYMPSLNNKTGSKDLSHVLFCFVFALFLLNHSILIIYKNFLFYTRKSGWISLKRWSKYHLRICIFSLSMYPSLSLTLYTTSNKFFLISHTKMRRKFETRGLINRICKLICSREVQFDCFNEHCEKTKRLFKRYFTTFFY